MAFQLADELVRISEVYKVGDLPTIGHGSQIYDWTGSLLSVILIYSVTLKRGAEKIQRHIKTHL